MPKSSFERVADEPLVVGVWVADADGQPWITVLTSTFDDNLEERLHHAFYALVEGGSRLDIRAIDEPHAEPYGSRVPVPAQKRATV